MNLEKIAEDAERFNGKANIAAINRAFRRADESHLWPVLGKFDATERAIRRVRAFVRESGCPMYGLEYAYALDSEISRTVNGW